MGTRRRPVGYRKWASVGGHKCSDFGLNRFDLVYTDLKLGVIDLEKLENSSRDSQKKDGEDLAEKRRELTVKATGRPKMSKLNSSSSELDLDRQASPDSFTRCFKSIPPQPWNWNVYLFPLWCLGVGVRYLILFPLRVLVLTLGHDKLRKKLERGLVELICSFFVASWTGVVKYHGPRPSMRPKQVFVSNHTSMIDFIILEQMIAFAVIMQKHPGWVEGSRSRADNNPLLMFPEGTCVNNHYTVMFKKGAFELGCTVCPIAIKYNKIFVDAFWNSRN
ncbi:hypothetical protein Vadar_014805 [Vaccinium darrowii]|uniref:Uncharacterized protein n=1 Tax=Vaccinium darrowii TaxID=229202 RepID=A0ACB7Y7G5_9ERIC|nr:hypothetical protein Vadar_014805 [Vaccinium darrowii]